MISMSFSVRAMLVDDEPPARERMRQLLQSHPEIDIVGEAGDGDEALSLIRELRPDLVFLDIQMPGQSGIEVAARLEPPRPRIVFCTAFDQYALKAFEQHAVDYLLKPVSRARLRKAIEKVLEALGVVGKLADDLRRAEVTQAHLFPRTLPDLKTLEFTGFCQPAGGVGGDYYDFLPLSPDLLGIALADVSGKGIAGALLMAGVQGRLQSKAAMHGKQVGALMDDLNRSIYSTTEPGKYVTFFYAVYGDDDRIMTYANAGHNPPFLLQRRDDQSVSVRRLEIGGTVIGLFPSVDYAAGKVRLSPGDTLVLFTDGVTEAMNESEEEFGEQRLAELILKNTHMSVPKLAKLIRDAVSSHVGNAPLHDDLTMIIARAK
jgi:sigma-B regulation protein RsbU (phosphoserine phosphatase)